MNAESLKISLTQRILSINDLSFLEKIDQFLIGTSIVGYDSDGNPITEEEYRAELNRINNEIDNGTAQLFSSKEIKERIISENNLA
jgi:hypothetical protein